jgi:imidazolonepropionase-like amidohydrolase
MDMDMRDLINRNAMLGPRMYVCGYALLPTLAGLRTKDGAALWGCADGKNEVMRTVRREIAAGVDVIKMFASTGSADDVSGFQIYTFEEIKAAVDIAHSMGKRVAVHSYGPEAAHDAVIAGANSIEHATDLTDETIAEMVRRGTFYVPTIDHNRYYVEHANEYGYGPETVNKLNDFIGRNLETARRAHKAGVRFALGSDAVFTMFGENTRELSWFVRAGMTAEQALSAATSNGAVLLGMEHELGKVAAGYYADIVAVEGDPLKDIDIVINNVKWVMKGGNVVVDRTD